MPPKRKPSSTQDPPHLRPGCQVEVSSNDPGFRGSWFTASIIKHASSRNPKKFVVQYTHLFEDESGSKPLKETINAVDLRPLAPREGSRKFKFGEEVDAFYNDGWWEGVITNELRNGKFHVYFKRSKEQLEFGEDQLRLHREWVNGCWTPPLEHVPPEKKLKSNNRITENIFKSDKALTEEKVESSKYVTREKLKCDNTAAEKKLDSDKLGSGDKLKENFSDGEHVEVSSDEDGFVDAWFAATIVKAISKDRYLVQHKNLRTEDDTDFLKEEFDTLHIRPCPPEIIMTDRFKKLDKVDALYNDAWWVGVISKVLVDSKYVVYFKTTNEEIKFDHSKLRPHQDWIDGKWVATSEKEWYQACARSSSLYSS